MKKIILATLAAAALVACAKEDVVVAPKGEAIAFNNAFIDNSVRSIDPSITKDGNNALEGFVVYGTTLGDHDGAQTVNIFNGVNVGVNIDGVGDDWKYANNFVQYWIDGNYYSFAAVVNGSVTPDSDGMPKTIAYDATTQTDLLYAENDYGTYRKGTSETTVEFVFAHLLSKAKVTVKNNIATNSTDQAYTYKVSGVKITNAYATAKYDVDTEWGNFDGSYETVFGDVDTAVTNDALVAATGAINGNATAESHYERLIIPAEYTALNIFATIELYLNNQKVDVITYNKTVPTTVTLEAGHAYNFLISLGNPGDPIEFTVTDVNGWENGNSHDGNGDDVNDHVPAPVYPNN